MKLIVGLGNPGTKYQTTRHNIGFITLDEIALRKESRFNKEIGNAMISEFFINGEKIMLAKPQTFMNESGRSVDFLLNYFQIDECELLIIHDDMDLEPGVIRLRQKGSAGGHNGLKSIISYLGNQTFQRIKIGIGRPRPSESVTTHVLGNFPKNNFDAMLFSTNKAADAALYWGEGHSFVDTMNVFNQKIKEIPSE